MEISRILMHSSVRENKLQYEHSGERLDASGMASDQTAPLAIRSASIPRTDHSPRLNVFDCDRSLEFRGSGCGDAEAEVAHRPHAADGGPLLRPLLSSSDFFSTRSQNVEKLVRKLQK